MFRKSIQKKISQLIANYRIICGFQNTKGKEDFALTPYLFLVSVNDQPEKVYGIGLCWGYYAIYLAAAKNLPKGYPTFRSLP